MKSDLSYGQTLTAQMQGDGKGISTQLLGMQVKHGASGTIRKKHEQRLRTRKPGNPAVEKARQEEGLPCRIIPADHVPRAGIAKSLIQQIEEHGWRKMPLGIEKDHLSACAQKSASYGMRSTESAIVMHAHGRAGLSIKGISLGFIDGNELDVVHAVVREKPLPLVQTATRLIPIRRKRHHHTQPHPIGLAGAARSLLQNYEPLRSEEKAQAWKEHGCKTEKDSSQGISRHGQPATVQAQLPL